eukprot:scaffold976_cov214-Ochromonas_danica.AAC.10
MLYETTLSQKRHPKRPWVTTLCGCFHYRNPQVGQTCHLSLVSEDDDDMLCYAMQCYAMV